MPNGWGRPDIWVLDSGSGFKVELTEALETWDADWRESAPEHPQSHGAIERYNRTLCNKIAKMTDEQQTENWLVVRAAAVESMRQSVSEAISAAEARAPITPSELWHGGRQISMENVPSTRERNKVETAMSKFAKDLKSQVQKVVNWVKQSNSKYHEDMARRTAGKPVRKFSVGVIKKQTKRQDEFKARGDIQGDGSTRIRGDIYHKEDRFRQQRSQSAC